MRHYLIVLITLVTTSAAHAATMPKAASTQPMKFRCDTATIRRSPNQTICHNNFVATQGELLICCNKFLGIVNNQWRWTRFSCKGDVRVRKLNQLVWADSAEYDLTASTLTLKGGSPIIKKDHSFLTGSTITIDTNNQTVNITDAQGVLVQNKTSTSHQPTTDALPMMCPIAPKPSPQ